MGKRNRKNGEKRHLITNPILLKIHREFTHDEAVKTLEVEIKRLNYEIGVLKSEIAELNDLNTKLKALTSEEKVLLREETDDRKKKIKKLQNDVEDWRSKYFQLLASQRSLTKVPE